MLSQNKPKEEARGPVWSDEITFDGVLTSVDAVTDSPLQLCLRIATPMQPERALLQCENEEEFDLWMCHLGRLSLGGVRNRSDDSLQTTFGVCCFQFYLLVSSVSAG